MSTVPHLDKHYDAESEKGDVAHIEEKVDIVDETSSDQTEDIDAGFDPEFVKRTMRKVDWRLIPILGALYGISIIDRTNLAFARQANGLQMDKEIGTGVGYHYSIVTLVFFIPYVIFELPVSCPRTIARKS